MFKRAITGPYSKPVQSSPHTHTLFVGDPFQYYLPISIYRPQAVSFFQVFHLMYSMP